MGLKDARDFKSFETYENLQAGEEIKQELCCKIENNQQSTP